MPKTFTASQVESLLKKAASLPKGDAKRREILSALKRAKDEPAAEVVALKGKDFTVDVNLKMSLKGYVEDVWGDYIDIKWDSSADTQCKDIANQIAIALQKEIGFPKNYKYRSSGINFTVLPTGLKIS